MGRFRVVEAPELQPGVDYITGSSVGPFVDTGRDMTFGERKLGRIYLSKDTVAELAHELGITASATASQEALDRAYAQGQIDALKETLGADLVHVVRTLDRLVRALGPDVAVAAAAE